jgi:hypothetical protein
MLVLILPLQVAQYLLLGRQIIVYLVHFMGEIMLLLDLNLLEVALDELPNGHPETLLGLISLRSLVGLAQLCLRQRHGRLIDTTFLLLLLLTIYNLFTGLLITGLINLLGGRSGRASLQSLLVLFLRHCLFDPLICWLAAALTLARDILSTNHRQGSQRKRLNSQCKQNRAVHQPSSAKLAPFPRYSASFT